MEALYAFAFACRVEDSRELAQIHPRTRRARAGYLVLTVLALLGCPALILLGYKPAVIPLAVLALLALAAVLYLPALYAPLLRRRYMPGAFVGRREAAFYPEGFTFRGAQTALSVRYTAVRRVTETENLYLIALATGQVFYLRRDGLTAGDAQAFSAFLAERTGRAVCRRRGVPPAGRVRALAFAAAACFLLASCALALVWMRRPTMPLRGFFSISNRYLKVFTLNSSLFTASRFPYTSLYCDAHPP